MQPKAELMHFVAYYEDGSMVPGKPLGSLDTGWQGLPDKPIAKLCYVNPYGDMIVLQGYEEYNQMVECMCMMGEGAKINDVLLMGAKNGKVTVYRLRAFQRSKDDSPQVGDVTVRVCERGREYCDSESWGWRKGAGAK